MKDAILSVVKQILTSKKALAAIAGALVWGLGRLGWDIPAADLLPVIGIIAAFILGQGWADGGKEAAKVHAAHSLALREADAPADPS